MVLGVHRTGTDLDGISTLARTKGEEGNEMICHQRGMHERVAAATGLSCIYTMSNLDSGLEAV